MTSTASTEVGATTSGRAKSACALIGTISSASTPGQTTGPPALKLYAVEPVGVAHTTPSHPQRDSGRPSTSTTTSSIRSRAAFSTLASLSAKVLVTSSPSRKTDDVDGQPVLGGVATRRRSRRWWRRTSSYSASARNPTCPRFTPEQRRTAVVGELRGAQDRAVAADHDHQLAVRARVVAVRELPEPGIVVEPEGGGLVGQQPDLDVVPGQRVHQLAAPRRGPRARPGCASRSTRRWSVTVFTFSSGAPGGTGRHHSLDLGRPDRCSDRGAATGRTRRCPTVPGSGLTVTARAPQPRAAAASATIATASARSAGSRTTPPLPTRLRPTSNCGFTISTRSPSVGRDADQRVEHQRERDEGEVADDQVHRTADRSRGRARGCSFGRGPATRSSCEGARPAGRSRRRPPPPRARRAAAGRR